MPSRDFCDICNKNIYAASPIFNVTVSTVRGNQNGWIVETTTPDANYAQPIVRTVEMVCTKCAINAVQGLYNDKA